MVPGPPAFWTWKDLKSVKNEPWVKDVRKQGLQSRGLLVLHGGNQILLEDLDLSPLTLEKKL